MPKQTIKRHQVTPAYLLLTLLLALHCPGSNAESYYRWQDAQGNIHFGDTHPENAITPQLTELALQQPLYTVDKVIDGDTIVVRHGGKVRLLGINTPEIAHRDRAAEPLGNKAYQRLKQLLTGKKVYLEFDQQRRDRFKRLLAHVTLEDGTNLNELLLREGLARALFLQPNMQHLQHYYRVEAKAQEEKRGIWALPEFQIRPANKAGECIKHFCRLRGTVRKVDKVREIVNHELLDLIERPNVRQGHSRFFGDSVSFFLLGGNSPILRVGPGTTPQAQIAAKPTSLLAPNGTATRQP